MQQIREPVGFGSVWVDTLPELRKPRRKIRACFGLAGSKGNPSRQASRLRNNRSYLGVRRRRYPIPQRTLIYGTPENDSASRIIFGCLLAFDR